MGEKRAIVAYSNRLPVTRGNRGWQTSSGGLVSALRPALRRLGGAWVGWDGGARDLPARVEGLDVDLCAVVLNRREVDEYYHGFSNRTLWPLLHGLIETPVYERSWWRSYQAVNERFAATAVPQDAQDALRWVHDYHLMLVPELLRQRVAEGVPIGFFLHVPFPPPEVFSRLPWREQTLRGLLGADVVSFHTEPYRDNFLRTCHRTCIDVAIDGTTIRHHGRVIRTAVHPISIDAAELARQAVKPAVERHLRSLRAQFHGRRVLLGVDRLDYTKGILERLRAIELLLEVRPDLRDSLSFVQIAVPSRGEVREYRDLRQGVEELVGHINGRFTDPGHDVPVHYLHRSIGRDQLLAYYRLADVCLVTPLADGMNLVAKEFVTTQAAAGEAGVLILSEFTGASAELREALPCNPFDLTGLAGTITLALELEEDDRRARIAAMGDQVARNDVFAWLELELAAAAPLELPEPALDSALLGAAT
jgi:alpha,alpha-trehalose-phosphate synthase [UDP-forming]